MHFSQAGGLELSPNHGIHTSHLSNLLLFTLPQSATESVRKDQLRMI